MTGVIALIVALAVASAVGVGVRRRAGKVRSFPRTDDGDSSGTSPSAEILTEGDLGASLGERATLVQFSTEFCAYCGPARGLLQEIAAEWPGVAFVEVDAAERMDLTRRLRVFSTPTVLVLRPNGSIAARSAGKPWEVGRGRLAGETLQGALQQAVRSVLDDGVRS